LPRNGGGAGDDSLHQPAAAKDQMIAMAIIRTPYS
jgi:hypothetical protein